MHVQFGEQHAMYTAVSVCTNILVCARGDNEHANTHRVATCLINTTAISLALNFKTIICLMFRKLLT
jgi:hypothetical protein